MAEVIEQIEKDSADSKKSHRLRSGFWFGAIILLVVIGIAGAGYYLLMQLRERQSNLGGEVKGELSKKVADYQSQLSAIQSHLSTMESTLAGKDAHYTKALDDYAKLHNERLDNLRKEMSGSIQHLQRQLGKTRGDWLIADAEYLLSVANERLHLIGDVHTAIEALEASDQRLRESGDAAVFKVREEVAKEIAALKNVPVPDIVGLFGSVQALQEQVDQLALILPYSGKTPAPPAREKQEKPGAEGKADKSSDLVDSALNELEDIVTIRRTDQPIEEILTPQQVRFIREQLRVKLEMVKIALVQQNEAIFRASVQDAKAWTERNFTQSSQNQKFINELNRLSETKIRSHFPDISASLKMLRDITKLRIESDKAMTPLPEVPSVIDAPAAPAESAPAAPAASGAEPAPAAAVPSEKQ